MHAMRQQAPWMFNKLARSGKLEEHVQQKSEEAHQMLRDLLASEPKGPDGLPRDLNALRLAEEWVLEEMLDFPIPESVANGRELLRVLGEEFAGGAREYVPSSAPKRAKTGGVSEMPEVTSIEELERLVETITVADSPEPAGDAELQRQEEHEALRGMLRRQLPLAKAEDGPELRRLKEEGRALRREIRAAGILCFATTVGIAGVLMGWRVAVVSGIGVALGLVWFSEVRR